MSNLDVEGNSSAHHPQLQCLSSRQTRHLTFQLLHMWACVIMPSLPWVGGWSLFFSLFFQHSFYQLQPVLVASQFQLGPRSQDVCCAVCGRYNLIKSKLEGIPDCHCALFTTITFYQHYNHHTIIMCINDLISATGSGWK